MASPHTQPPTVVTPSRSQLVRAAGALFLSLLLFGGGCVSDPSPHPGVDPDYTNVDNAFGDVRGGGSDADPTATPGGEVEGEPDHGGCDVQGGETYGDVGPDGCGPADGVSPTDACDPSALDGQDDPGPEACGGGAEDGTAPAQGTAGH